MRNRRLITISLPPPLLKRVEVIAREENRTKSELVREALRVYMETREDRKQASRERVFATVERIRARTKHTPTAKIRKVIREALGAVRHRRRYTS